MPSPAAYFGLAAAGWISYQWYWFRENLKKVEHIPTVGSENFFGAWFSAWRYILSGHKMVEEGYKKYPNGVFKVPTFESSSRWIIVANGAKLVEDIRKASDDLVASDLPTIDYTHPTEWTSYPVLDTLLPVVTRTTNRFFVGLPLCRNRDYLSTLEKFAARLMLSAYSVTLSPSFMRPIMAYLTSNVPATEKKLKQYLGPIIEERLQQDAELGIDRSGKPNDMITWLLDLAPEELRTVDDVVTRLLISNFAAIHTTSNSLSDVLFHLAAYPEYVKPLREEIENVTREHGWTKEAMVRLHKLDSFMKEVGRMAGVNVVASQRKARQAFTLSNGVTIPAGFTVGIASNASHHDPHAYDDASTFNGFRFVSEASSDPDAESSTEQVKRQMVSLDTKYVLFGVGRHACPGRFFAVNEIKAMAAYVLLNYDMKLPGDDPHLPAGFFFGSSRSANPTAHILFRKRASAT
ncbi:hypothetical protein MD484_g1225, partial [Candolleomyces efflorescens]